MAETLRTRNFEDIAALKATSGVSQAEGMRLAWLASQVPDGGTIVEIGSCQGRSAAYMVSGVKEKQDGKDVRPRVQIYCVDLWDLGVGLTPERHHSDGAFHRFKSNLMSLGLWEMVTPVKMFSVEAAMKFRKLGKRIDLLFIDGGHDYKNVKADLQAWKGFVVRGGVIACHDFILPRHPEVMRAVKEEIRLPQWGSFEVVERLFSAVKAT